MCLVCLFLIGKKKKTLALLGMIFFFLDYKIHTCTYIHKTRISCLASTSCHFLSPRPSLLCYCWHRGRNQARPEGHWKWSEKKKNKYMI